MYIRNYTYSAEDVDCKLCTEHFGRNGCRQDFCPYYAERIEAGVISYGEAISSLIPPTSSIRNRLPGLIHGFPGSLWADGKHKTRMEVFNNRLGYIKSRNTPSYYAVLYLLTSNDALYRRTANCFFHGGIDFSYAVLRGISPHNYALFCAAKGLRHAGGVTESELADPMTIDDEAFRLIMNALLIAKYGTAAFHLKGETFPMSRDFGVTDGHPLYSLHRYRSDVRHMVIFDDLVEKEHHRVRLYVSNPVYEMIRQAEADGLLRIVHHEEIVEGCSEPDSPRRRKHKHK